MDYGEAKELITFAIDYYLAQVRRASQYVVGATTASSVVPEPQVIISKEFKNNNPALMEQEINDWLENMCATEIHHINAEKDPASQFGLIKTVFIKVPKSKAAQNEDE